MAVAVVAELEFPAVFAPVPPEVVVPPVPAMLAPPFAMPPVVSALAEQPKAKPVSCRDNLNGCHVGGRSFLLRSQESWQNRNGQKVREHNE